MNDRPPSDSSTTVATDTDTDVERGIASSKRPEVELAVIESRREKGTSTDPEKSSLEETTQPSDPNIVDWEGPDDPMNPQNWPEKNKWANIACISMLTLVTYVVLPLFCFRAPRSSANTSA